MKTPPLTKQVSIVSGSSQLTMSYDERYEGRSKWNKNIIKFIDSGKLWRTCDVTKGIISSSEQFHTGKYQVQFKY